MTPEELAEVEILRATVDGMAEMNDDMLALEADLATALALLSKVLNRTANPAAELTVVDRLTEQLAEAEVDQAQDDEGWRREVARQHDRAEAAEAQLAEARELLAVIAGEYERIANEHPEAVVLHMPLIRARMFLVRLSEGEQRISGR